MLHHPLIMFRQTLPWPFVTGRKTAECGYPLKIGQDGRGDLPMYGQTDLEREFCIAQYWEPASGGLRFSIQRPIKPILGPADQQVQVGYVLVQFADQGSREVWQV